MDRWLPTNQLSTVSFSRHRYSLHPLTFRSQLGVLGFVQVHSGVNRALSYCFVVVDPHPVFSSSRHASCTCCVYVFYRSSVPLVWLAFRRARPVNLVGGSSGNSARFIFTRALLKDADTTEDLPVLNQGSIMPQASCIPPYSKVDVLCWFHGSDGSTHSVQGEGDFTGDTMNSSKGSTSIAALREAIVVVIPTVCGGTLAGVNPAARRRLVAYMCAP